MFFKENVNGYQKKMLFRKRNPLELFLEAIEYFLFCIGSSPTLTRKKVCLKALLGHSVVWLELNPQVVVQGSDGVGPLCTTEPPMKLRVRTHPASHFHKVVLANLKWDTRIHHWNRRANKQMCNTEKPTSLPSVSKPSKRRVMRYWVGATSCQTQFLLGG